ncbi:hypothetical protein VNO77_19389 [Canavalia gladiata]|uniref:Uncharacterized protein n=1 Tax=Canavalia gladiata TaxID=3824 RepID=A0AAN9LR88_CANGL
MYAVRSQNLSLMLSRLDEMQGSCQPLRTQPAPYRCPPPDSSFIAHNRKSLIDAPTGRATTFTRIVLFKFVRWEVEVDCSLQMPQAIVASLPAKV